VHVFPTRVEADQYHGVVARAEAALDAPRLLRDLVADLKARGRIAPHRPWDSIPLVGIRGSCPPRHSTYVNPRMRIHASHATQHT